MYSVRLDIFRMFANKIELLNKEEVEELLRPLGSKTVEYEFVEPDNKFFENNVLPDFEIDAADYSIHMDNDSVLLTRVGNCIGDDVNKIIKQLCKGRHIHVGINGASASLPSTVKEGLRYMYMYGIKNVTKPSCFTWRLFTNELTHTGEITRKLIL